MCMVWPFHSFVGGLLKKCINVYLNKVRIIIHDLEGMGSSSHDLGAEIRMHSITVNCDIFFK